MENREKTIEELNDVLEKTYDSVEGYRKAAENTNNTRLMGYFNKQVIERKGFIDELTAEVKKIGGTPKTDGTVGGTLHRAWIDFKTAFTSKYDDEALLETCITGEENCISEYNDLLEEKYVPASTRQLLTKQKLSIESTLRILKVKEEIEDNK